MIELKRPSQPINAAVINQIESYGFAIAADDRFQNVRANWSFWAISTRMDKYAQLKGSTGNHTGISLPLMAEKVAAALATDTSDLDGAVEKMNNTTASPRTPGK